MRKRSEILKKEYHNVPYMRTCPNCNSKNYERTLTYAHITISKDGKTRRFQKQADAGTFTCFDCGFKVTI